MNPDAGDAAEADASDDESVRYHEPVRGWRSLLYTLAALAAGFCVDLSLGVHGAILHLPGWALFGAVLLGIHWLILYAARSTHSLTITDTQLKIGEEMLALDSLDRLVAPAEVEGQDVPVLGWPGGRPRGMGSLIVRTTDGRDVVVPTRSPERLRAELGLSDPTPPAPVRVRPASEADLELLEDIDDRADALFRVAGYALPDLDFDRLGLDCAAAVFVADDPPVGFVILEVVDGAAYVGELAVLPSAMRQGLGTRLLEASCAWAKDEGLDSITLTTFADVPWNAPFYAARGFVVWDDPSPGLVELRRLEAERGLDEVGRRIVMRRLL